MIFCDTSALAKFYVQESESAKVRRIILEDEDVSASELARVELMAVFHRRLREGKWIREVFHEVVQQFLQDDLGGYWKWHPLDPATLEAASRAYQILPDSVFLRATDCIHLATAVRHNHPSVLTFDAQQMAAARAFGLVVDGNP